MLETITAAAHEIAARTEGELQRLALAIAATAEAALAEARAAPTVSAKPVATDRERGIWQTAITLANNICVQECDRINDEDGPMPAIDATNKCAKRIREWVDPSDDQFAAMLAEAGVIAPPPVSVGAEPFGWVLITGQGEVFRSTKPDCLIDRWRPVWTAPPPVEASQQAEVASGEPYLAMVLKRKAASAREGGDTFAAVTPADCDKAADEISRITAELSAAKAEAEALRRTLQGIADADWREWDDGYDTPSEFVHWAKSRARAAIAAQHGEK